MSALEKDIEDLRTQHEKDKLGELRHPRSPCHVHHEARYASDHEIRPVPFRPFLCAIAALRPPQRQVALALAPGVINTLTPGA